MYLSQGFRMWKQPTEKKTVNLFGATNLTFHPCIKVSWGSGFTKNTVHLPYYWCKGFRSWHNSQKIIGCNCFSNVRLHLWHFLQKIKWYLHNKETLYPSWANSLYIALNLSPLGICCVKIQCVISPSKKKLNQLKFVELLVLNPLNEWFKTRLTDPV